MSDLERAALAFYDFIAPRIGENADYPIHLTADNDDDMETLLERLNALRDAAIAVRSDAPNPWTQNS